MYKLEVEEGFYVLRVRAFAFTVWERIDVRSREICN